MTAAISGFRISAAASIAAGLLLTACASGPSIDAAPPAAAAPSAPVFVLGDILGARPQTIDALLGAPALTRSEGAGEYRRYGLTSCTLIIILYPDEAGAPHVAYVDTAAQKSGAEKPDLEACLAAG